MASNNPLEDGECTDTENFSDGTNLSVISPNRNTDLVRDADHAPRTEPHTKTSKTKKTSKYSELAKRFTLMEEMMQKMLENQSAPGNKLRHKVLSDSEEETDRVSLFACGQISPNNSDHPDENEQSEHELDKNNNTNAESDFSKEQRKCLFDIFGDDAVVKKAEKKDGLVLDDSQIEVLSNSYRCKEPNYLSAFSEENYDMFPVDSDSEKLLQVPSMDATIESCLTKRYGNRASFVRNKGKHLFGQPAKMVEKIAYKGQQASRLGLVIQMYVQQSLGNLLQFIQSDDFEKDKATQQVKDVFAMTTKCLDQIGRTGAFHHIIRRSVAMTDSLLFEQPDHSEFSNLPLTGTGVFGPELESLLKARKEKKKQIDDLIPDMRKRDLKRKHGSSTSSESTQSSYKKPALDTSGSSQQSGSNWNNFRIPRVPRDNKYDNKNRSSRSGNNSYTRRSSSYRTSGPKSAKADEK